MKISSIPKAGRKGSVVYLNTRQRINLNPVTQYRTMPTTLERTGDFSHSLDASGKLIPIIDPATHAAFPGNVIPKNQINAVGQAVLNFLPAPNYSDPNPSLVNQRNYIASGSAQFPRRNTTIRIDANPTSRFHIYWRFIQEPSSRITPGANGSPEPTT